MPDVASSNASSRPSENIISSLIETDSEKGGCETSGSQEVSPLPAGSKGPQLDGGISTFTFQPQLNKNSRRLSQTLETDFMSRQQKHLEKQQKYYNQAIHYDTNERLPEAQTSKKEKEDGHVMSSVENRKDRHFPTPEEVSLCAGEKELAALERSVTMQTIGEGASPKTTRRRTSNLNPDRLRQAKQVAERAMKEGKIFTIIGPYARIREVMRGRGWVEKFYRLHEVPQPTRRKSPRNGQQQNEDDDDDDDDDDGGDDDDNDNSTGQKIPPWEEEDGYYGLLSRMVRNAAPTFIWSLRKAQVDFRYLKREQIVNHHAHASSFTTKVGLCRNLRQLPWFTTETQKEIFPRCYVLSANDDKDAFIEDFRDTACISFIGYLVDRHRRSRHRKEPDGEEEEEEEEEEDTDTARTEKEEAGGGGGEGSPKLLLSKKARKAKKVLPKINYNTARREGLRIASKFIDIALQQCLRITERGNHADIDRQEDPYWLSDAQWNEFLEAYYKVVNNDAEVEGVERKWKDLEIMYDMTKELVGQPSIDGYRNVWIIKPGAKSRGRGIICRNRLDQILAMVPTSDISNRDSRYVVQKYIERPYLVYNTKFDLRQWFVVTDWAPLTVWWYKDSYIRFCSQQFTLEDFDESVHLSNNSIQYKYENGPRSPYLPDDNMWDTKDLQRYLIENGARNQFEETIYPGMKRLVINALLCCQDSIEVRKNCFELYGADFMISEDYRPWLIEINSSPDMSASTQVTARMTAAVLDDTVKVVVDRRFDRNCSVGKFEMIYKQQMTNVPQYVGIDLTLAGTHIKRPWNNSTVIDSSNTFRANPPPNFVKANTTNITARHSVVPASNTTATGAGQSATRVSISKTEKPKAEAKPKPERPKVEKREKEKEKEKEKGKEEKEKEKEKGKEEKEKETTKEEAKTESKVESKLETEASVPKPLARPVERRPAPVSVIRPIRAREPVHRGPTRVEVVNLAQRAFAQKMPSIHAAGNQRGAPRTSHPAVAKASADGLLSRLRSVYGPKKRTRSFHLVESSPAHFLHLPPVRGFGESVRPRL